MMPKYGRKSGYLRFLSQDDCRAIHMSAIEVLETVGMQCESDTIMDVFDKAGAEVDRKKRLIFIPEHLVMESIQKAPKKVTLWGRTPGKEIVLYGDYSHFGLGGTPCPNVQDIDTHEIRQSTKQDAANFAKVANALPMVEFGMSIAGALDVPREVEYIHEFEVSFKNLEKPLIHPIPGVEANEVAIEMASAIVGGREELRKKPIFSAYCETAQPLMFVKENDNMILNARAGIPVTLGPAAMMGATAPATLAGANVVTVSENLAAITLTQLVAPHSPVIFGAWASVMDPYTTRCLYAAPEFALGTAVLCKQMAEFYGMPNFGFAGPSDSKVPDAQAGAEAMEICLMNALVGNNLLHDGGYLAGGGVGSLEMCVILDEIFGYVDRILRGIEVTAEHLAVDVIRDVGAGGNFLSHKHTLKHLERTMYLGSLFDRTSEETWVKAGSKDMYTVANERVKKILKEHEPTPLDKDVEKKISSLVAEATKKLVK
ncbi:MAG: trimethylamine methyltransferase family protein [Candidatus Thorarchaeota archaeon]